jgi:O-methyltransferase / aklanonic acid methyltransferase
MSGTQADRKSQVRQQFNTVVADYDRGPGCFAHFGRRLVAVANVEPGQRILDVASGRGAAFFPAAEQVGPTGDVVGIDLAEEMVRATNEEAARRGFAARVRVMDAEHLDFPDATFDRVLCGFGVMFFPDQDRGLGEFARVLKPGGRLAVSTWHVTQAHELDEAMIVSGMNLQRSPGWITEPGDLSRLLMRAGFTDLCVTVDWQSFRYSGVDEYWQQARGTGMRRALDALDAGQTERLRAALSERMHPHQRPDGIYVPAAALLAVAVR